MFNPQEAEAALALALMAALADGRTDASEREQIRSLFESLAKEHGVSSLSQIHQRVVLRQTTPEAEIDRLASPEARKTAFELAVCVADADGTVTPKEQAFLDRLEVLMGLEHAEAARFEQEAVDVARGGLPVSAAGEQPVAPTDLLGDVAPPLPVTLPAATTALTPAGVPAAATAPVDPRRAEADRITLRYAMLNGALELLPQNLATMAILPLQVRMVYAIGRQYGFTLSGAHIKEFIATLGLGATSQMLENMARKALGSFLKKSLGKTAAKVATAATGPMITFATTYAIGMVAQAYYAGGRQLSAVDLRGLFERHLAQGRSMYERVRPEIETQARTLNPAKVLDLVRGKQAQHA